MSESVLKVQLSITPAEAGKRVTAKNASQSMNKRDMLAPMGSCPRGRRRSKSNHNIAFTVLVLHQARQS
jgi:hypothetical protein